MPRPQKIEVSRLPANLTEKWGQEILLEGFTPLPKRLLRVLTDVFRGENGMANLATILAVADYRRPGLKRPPSVEILAFVAGLSESEFKACLRDMAERKWITVKGSDQEISVDINPMIEHVLSKTADRNTWGDSVELEESDGDT